MLACLNDFVPQFLECGLIFASCTSFVTMDVFSWASPNEFCLADLFG